MILAAAVLIAVVVGMLRGGNLGRLANLPFHGGWIALIAFVLQAYDIYFPEPTWQGYSNIRVVILIASYLAIFFVVWLNRTLPGIWLIGAGFAANFFVMILNGGYMPITIDAVEQIGNARKVLGAEPGARVIGTKDIILPKEATIGWWLSDIFVLPPPFPIPSVFSLGDALIAAGVFWLVQNAMCAVPMPENQN
jgi:uncharacterized protein DUF5317